MEGWFEVRAWDAAGRLGHLEVPRQGVTVETPALLPVINPNKQTISPQELAETFGVEILITNAYIIHNDETLRSQARGRGLHELLEFSGAIMTDSGSFQLAEYGDIDVTTQEILAFQRAIGSDIGTPVDIPTDPAADRETAADELAETERRLATAADVDTGDMLVTAPVQGGQHPDLREDAAATAYRSGLDVFPIGGVVPLLNQYRYDTVVDVVAGAKRGLGADAPVHLFGAGHPMMFALAVALGCDLFDSAAYAIYARDDRYMTVGGTQHLRALEHFPCSCPMCSSTTPAAVRELPAQERATQLSAHNLHVSMAEMRRIRQAIRDGQLLELVDLRARGHPALLDGYRSLLDHATQLERTDRVSKGTVFCTSHESARRPEVLRYHERLGRLSTPTRLLVTERSGSSDEYDETWGLVPPFGPVPGALAQTYPLTAERPETVDRAAIEAAATGVSRLAETHPDTAVTLEHRGWPTAALNGLPDAVETIDTTGDQC